MVEEPTVRAGTAPFISLSNWIEVGLKWERQRNDRIEKTCQHSAMKHSKQNKRPPQNHPPVLAVPSYHRILFKHGLIEKTLSIPDAYEVF